MSRLAHTVLSVLGYVVFVGFVVFGPCPVLPYAVFLYREWAQHRPGTDLRCAVLVLTYAVLFVPGAGSVLSCWY